MLDLRHNHGTDTTAGYRIVRTDWTDGMANLRRTLMATVVGSTNYGRALDLVRELRERVSATQYGVIDTMYRCGCTSHEVTDSEMPERLDMSTGLAQVR